MCTADATGRGAQASRERLAEITSGTTLVQQGLAATCKDVLYKVRTESRERMGVGRMSP